MVRNCDRVIDAGTVTGICNERIKEVLAEAKKLGKLEMYHKC